MDNLRPSKLETAVILGAGAVLGAGVVLGASGIYMYYKVNRTVKYELGHISNTLDTLAKEIEELRNPTSSKNVTRIRKTKFKTSSLSSFGATSSGDEEFYDFSDEELEPSFDVSSAVSVEDLCEKVDTLLDGSVSDREEAYLLLKQNASHYSENVPVLWRLAKACHLRALNFGSEGDNERKKDCAFQGKEFATKALRLEENSAEVHKWYAITVGSASEFLGVQERIQHGYIFKEHVVKGIELSPEDSTLYHMLGRWCYEVYMLPWWQRNLAATLIAVPPQATAQEARDHFNKAEELHFKDWKENKLFIAKTYLGEGDYTNAILWLDKAVNVSCTSDEDKQAHEEAITLQSKYQGYRS